MALEGASREQFRQILKREVRDLPFAAIQMIEQKEPEDVARWFVNEIEERRANDQILMFLLS